MIGYGAQHLQLTTAADKLIGWKLRQARFTSKNATTSDYSLQSEVSTNHTVITLGTIIHSVNVQSTKHAKRSNTKLRRMRGKCSVPPELTPTEIGTATNCFFAGRNISTHSSNNGLKCNTTLTTTNNTTCHICQRLQITSHSDSIKLI